MRFLHHLSVRSGRGGEVDAEAIHGRSGRVHVDDGDSCCRGVGAFKLESFPVGVVRHLWWLVSHHAGGRGVSQEEAVAAYLYPKGRVQAEPLNEEKKA
jgi:hypothetical protein